MLEVLQVDITTLDVDVIVNAANSGLRGGGGVDGAIHRAAGPDLLAACRRIGGCPTGHAVLTPGFRLPARFVIHAVGPVWEGGGRGEPALLRCAYQAAFAVARGEPSVRSIAFPAISTGAYGFPREQAARIALEVMREHAAQLDRLVAAVFSAADRELYLATLAGLGPG
ncbi:MAG TPA: O-acetyl-ADP-ribose deacetylase [Myxococcaceae bacterium]